MAMQTQGGESDDVMSEINVTPLVDVMLVLLVVFIVTAPLLSNAIHVNLPKTDQTAPPEIKEAVNVSVDAQGKIFLDKREIALESVEPELKSLKEKDPEMSLHLHGDDGANYGIVAKVMASIERAGIQKLQVLTSVQ
ncbi:MAG: biopolymer transporter ExbD [Methylococcaceae bacterium]|nr:biopolymer transporter ExbD [Methylococcaceae bacterium]